MSVPAVARRAGHFLVESGLHADRWFDLDAMLREPQTLAAPVARLAALLAPFAADAICGPWSGGAIVGFGVAQHLGASFFPATRAAQAPAATFAARYRVSPDAERAVSGRRVAIVDDMIAAGSATLATHRALVDAGASVVAVGALYTCGPLGRRALRALGVPVVRVADETVVLHAPEDCPLCRAGVPLEHAESA